VVREIPTWRGSFFLMDEITVVVLGGVDEPALNRLKHLGPGVTVKVAGTAEELGPALADARVLFQWAGNKDELRKVMEGAPKLEWIHGRYAGLDAILFPELIESPIPLTNGRGSFSQSLGEFVMCGAFYFAKDLPRMLRAKAERRWEVFDVMELSCQTLGIVGHGDIGRAIASRAKAMGMRVLALRRDTSPRPGDEHVDKVYPNAELHSMLPLCDYVVAAAPLTPRTRHMIGAAEFAVMKPDAIVMNVGRGPVIDEAAIVNALREKRIRGAVLDVFEVEPLPSDSPLWQMDNVLISFHTADHTKDWLDDAVSLFVEQFGRWRKGEPLKNVVDKRAGY
jgi:phosphoglycerate dehydrogenase-like enzyme